jgi:hypothetical protein
MSLYFSTYDRQLQVARSYILCGQLVQLCA